MTAADLEHEFLSEYLRATGDRASEVLLARVGAYLQVSLARIAVRSRQQLKPGRVLVVAQQLLAEDRRRPVRTSYRPSEPSRGTHRE